MLTLDEAEVEIVRIALSRFRHEAQMQADGTENYRQVTGAAWCACTHMVRECDDLLVRIEQHQAKEKNDGG